MSNFLAIATVTAALRRLVLEAVQADVSGATVTTVRPAEPGSATGIPALGVNLALYQVAPIAPLRNETLPARRTNGTVVQPPAAALELHYLLSFYGNESLLETQRLLGSTVARLMAEPVLTRDRINAALADPQLPFLASSNLRDQVDLVKLTPLGLSLEEMSRIWSVYYQTKYALSVAWRASAVFVEPTLRTTTAAPVLQSRVLTVPIRQPVITRIVAAAGNDAFILPASPIVIRGELLRGDDTVVTIAGNPVPTTRLTDHAVELTLPPGIEAGPVAAQILHRVALGVPPLPHRGFESNPGEFVLHPAINQITIANLTGNGPNPRSADVTVTTTPSVGPRQQVTLELLTPATALAPARVAFTCHAEERSAATTSLAFQLRDLPAGEYVVRIRVNGADSPCDRDTTPGSPTFGQPVAPVLTLN